MQISEISSVSVLVQRTGLVYDGDCDNTHCHCDWLFGTHAVLRTPKKSRQFDTCQCTFGFAGSFSVSSFSLGFCLQLVPSSCFVLVVIDNTWLYWRWLSSRVLLFSSYVDWLLWLLWWLRGLSLHVPCMLLLSFSSCL